LFLSTTHVIRKDVSGQDKIDRANDFLALLRYIAAVGAGNNFGAL
jgi:hypothetical protein